MEGLSREMVLSDSQPQVECVEERMGTWGLAGRILQWSRCKGIAVGTRTGVMRGSE